MQLTRQLSLGLATSLGRKCLAVDHMCMYIALLLRDIPLREVDVCSNVGVVGKLSLSLHKYDEKPLFF